MRSFTHSRCFRGLSDLTTFESPYSLAAPCFSLHYQETTRLEWPNHRTNTVKSVMVVGQNMESEVTPENTPVEVGDDAPRMNVNVRIQGDEHAAKLVRSILLERCPELSLSLPREGRNPRYRGRQTYSAYGEFNVASEGGDGNE